jgi:hypothetical protein
MKIEIRLSCDLLARLCESGEREFPAWVVKMGQMLNLGMLERIAVEGCERLDCWRVG